jgi:hypothetical protein
MKLRYLELPAETGVFGFYTKFYTQRSPVDRPVFLTENRPTAKVKALSLSLSLSLSVEPVISNLRGRTRTCGSGIIVGISSRDLGAYIVCRGYPLG